MSSEHHTWFSSAIVSFSPSVFCSLSPFSLSEFFGVLVGARTATAATVSAAAAERLHVVEELGRSYDVRSP